MTLSRYPALQIPNSVPADLRSFLEGVKERLEITTGDRGDPRDRLLTVRDIETAGMASVTVRNKYATLSGGVTATSVTDLIAESGDTGSFAGLLVPDLESLTSDAVDDSHDFIVWSNDAARVQRVPYETMRGLFLTEDTDAEVSGNWVFTNESLPVEIRSETPRLRFTETPFEDETLPVDGNLWDWFVDSQALTLALLSDDEEPTEVEMLTLVRDGQTPQYLALLNDTQLRIQDGVLADPGLTFDDDDDTGLYRIGANRLGFGTGGVLALDMQSTQLAIRDGSAAVPMLAFQSDVDTGFFRAGADALGVATGGAERLWITTSGIQTVDGTVALPSYSFINDLDTGFYRIGANNIGVTLNGVKQVDIATTGMTVTNTVTASSLLGSGLFPFVGWVETTQSANEQIWGTVANSKVWQLNTYAAGFSGGRAHLLFTRGTGVAVSNITLGNSTDNPTYTFASTGLATFAGGLTVVGTVTVPNTSFTYAKLQNVSATNRVLGRVTAGAGVIEELTPANLVTLLATADGAGTGLDADLLDGIDSVAFAQRAIAQTISGAWDFTGTQYFKVTAANAALISGLVDGGSSIVAHQELRLHRIGAEPFFIAVRINGSYASPTPVLSGQILGEFAFGGYDGSTLKPQAVRLYTSATEDWSTTANGSELFLQTTTTGTTTKATRFRIGGNSTGGYAQFPSGVASQPGIGFASDTDNGLYLSGTNEFSGATGGSQRFTVNSNAFSASVPVRGPDGTIGSPSFAFTTSPTTGFHLSAANEITLGTANVRRVTWDASGRTLFGGLTSSVQVGTLAGLTVQIGSTGNTGMSIARFSADGTAPVFNMGKSRGVLGAFDAVQSGDNLARWQFAGADGTSLNTPAAGVYIVCAGTVSTGVVPGEMQFYCTSTAGAFTEVQRLTAGGTVLHRDGTVALPSISLLNDPDSGMYRIAANQIGISCNATNVLDLSTATVAITATTIRLNTTTATTVGAAGAAAALPAQPLGYISANIGGTAVKIPYYSN